MQSPLDVIDKEAMQLPEGHKVALAHRMLLSAEPAPNPVIDVIWDAELAKRIEKLDSGQAARHPAAEVFGELDRRFQG